MANQAMNQGAFGWVHPQEPVPIESHCQKSQHILGMVVPRFLDILQVDRLGVSINAGTPNSWMVFKLEISIEMDDDWVKPYVRKPPDELNKYQQGSVFWPLGLALCIDPAYGSTPGRVSDELRSTSG